MDSGGAVSLYYGMPTLTAKNCTFINNTAYTGGAMDLTNSDVNISNSNFSHNSASYGGAADLYYGNLVMTNCRISNNTAHANAGVFRAQNLSIFLSNCQVFNNTGNVDGGVVISTHSEIVITNSIFKMNRALGIAGVFYISTGSMILRNSWFAKNFAGGAAGVLYSIGKAIINITQCIFFENKAGHLAGALYVLTHTNVFISNTKINQNTADIYGALIIDSNSTLELYGSQVEGNKGESMVGAMYVSNSSLVISFNSTFQGNSAYQDSTIRISKSTVYLEECTFIENQMTNMYYGGTVSILELTKLKISNTVFTQNRGYNIFYLGDANHSINKVEMHSCIFVQGNISLKSNVKNFEEIAVKEKVIGQLSLLNGNYLTSLEPPYRYLVTRETTYASSKMFHILNIYN